MNLTIGLRSLLCMLLMYYATTVHATSNVILVVGDSLSAAYKIKKTEGWVNLLSQKLHTDGYAYNVINASTSGATTADGLRRLPQQLAKNNPVIVIIALGSNDGLRGNPINTIHHNLAEMIQQAKAANAEILLIGFHMPYNYGEQYRKEFAAIFTTLSKEFTVPLVPFLLEGFGDNLNYFQADQLHPTAAAQPLILNNVWPHLEPLL